MLSLTWKDETEIDFDHTVVFGHGYDFDGFELFRQEAQTLHGRFAMWPEMRGPHRATLWSVYDATDGDLQLGKFASDVEAAAYAYAKAAARNLSASADATQETKGGES